MNTLWSRFSLRPKQRNYALLDPAGVCLAFRQCTTPPLNAGWVEIHEFCVSWLNRPLPDKARITEPAARSSALGLLAL